MPLAKFSSVVLLALAAAGASAQSPVSAGLSIRPSAISAFRMPASQLIGVDAAQETQQPNAPPSNSTEPQQNSPQTPEVKEQPKRILWVIPNYRAVSSDAKLPPLTTGGKFKLMIYDSFDYSAFIYTGFVAGLRFAANNYPELGHGAAGYGRYYWRSFVDQAVGDFFTEFALPSLLKQDPRYFTKGHGGFFPRTGYALSRLVITRSDKGTEQFNLSEIAGNLAAAGISNAYYPAPERGVGNTFNNWGVQLALDAGFNALKEFWPDIQHKILHIGD